MHDFIEFLGEPVFYARSNCILYRTSLEDGEAIACIVHEVLDEQQLAFLNKIVHAIKAAPVELCKNTAAKFDYYLCFGVDYNVATKLSLPDLTVMQSDQNLKKQAWLELKKVFL